MRSVSGTEREGPVHPAGPVNPQGGTTQQPGQPRKCMHQHGAIVVLLRCPHGLVECGKGLGQVACTCVEGRQGQQAGLEAAAVRQGVCRGGDGAQVCGATPGWAWVEGWRTPCCSSSPGPSVRHSDDRLLRLQDTVRPAR